MTSSLPQPAFLSLERSYSQTDWQKGYLSLYDEFDYAIDEVEGCIPPDLEGTLFRNGPGLLDVNGQRIQHPFDGDGLVCAIRLQNGAARFQNRYVRTAGYVAEQQAGKILYRGVFGTDKPGGWLANALDFKLKNIANTNVIYWGNKLLALWEAAAPYRLDPVTLETIGLDDLDGILPPGGAFSAHPWIDPAGADGAPCLVNFALKTGLSSQLTLFEISPSGQLLRQSTHPIPGFAFIHDFAITPNYCLFFQNPVSFNPLPFLAGFRTAGECIQFYPERSTRIIVVPRRADAPIPEPFDVQAGFVFHHANAFEQGNELIIDSICYAKLPSVDPQADYRQTDFDALPPGQLWRFWLDLNSGSVEKELLEPRCCEFPSLHPAKVGRAYRYAYLGAAHHPIGNAPLQAILKLDLETGDRCLWSAAPRGYVSEPIFVPRSHQSYRNGLPTATVIGAEDDGWVLTLIFNAESERSELVILEATNLQPVATLKLKHHVPYGLHGSFTPICF